MSARGKLVELVLKNEPDHGNTMFVDLLGCAMTAEEMKGSVLLWLDAYRAEVLREARREILALSLNAGNLVATELWKDGYKGGLCMAADICTP